MNKIVIHNSDGSGAAMGYLLTAGAFYGVSLTLSESMLSLICIGLALVIMTLGLIEVFRAKATVALDTDTGTVTLKQKALIRQIQIERFPLRDFSSVISFIDSNRYPSSCVELVEKGSQRTLRLATFTTSWWAAPTAVEPPEATALRAKVSLITGIPNGGFVGERPGLPKVRVDAAS
jgi:hypothetical protein